MAQTCHQQQRAILSDSANDIRGGEKRHTINGKEQDKTEIAIAGSANSGHKPHNAPLNIAIVGAGIGGLTAAIGLRQNGHNVAVSLE
jgi:ribulose 1,5-bisphosphate synthetase/thiazole synthase